jgi:hypothetical protein
MAILYKPFKPFRTALCLLFAGFFCWPLFNASLALAQSQPYVVEGVKVDISADNAMNARTQAFEKAQQDAIVTLAGQFFAQDRLAAFRPPAATVISPMIQDYEVTQEKLSSKRYIATYTFRFKRAAVSQFFDETGLQVSSGADPAADGGLMTSAEPVERVSSGQGILILPFYQVGQQTLLWSGYNGWMEAWRRTGNVSNQILPLGDLSDVADVSDDEALSYDEAGLSRILSRYGAREAVVAIAAPDSGLVRLPSDSTPASGVLKVNIYRTDRRDGPEHVGQIILTTASGETRGRLFDRAVLQVQETLQTNWKNTAYVSPPLTRNMIEMRVPFSNLQEWAAAQRALTRIQGVNDIVLKSLTPREARIGLVYDGDADTLRIALQQAGMDLSNLTAEGDASYAPQAVYDLYLSPRSGPSFPSAAIEYAPPQEPVYAPLQPPEASPRYEQPTYAAPESTDSYIRSF